MNLRSGQVIKTHFGFEYEVLSAVDDKGFFTACRRIDGRVKDVHLNAIAAVDGAPVKEKAAAREGG